MAHRYVLAYFICTFGLVAGQSPKYALKGLEVSIIPSLSGQPDEILWKHNGNKVVEFNGIEQEEYSRYKNRVTLDWVTADLSITHLTYEDSGDYELEIYMNNKVVRSRYKLEVIDKVAKPTISCEMIDGSSSDKSGIQAKLVCSAESSRPQSLMKFEWDSDGKVLPGPNLTISLGHELDDKVHSCVVSNPLTSDRATFTAKDCYHEKSSSVGLIVGIVVFFAIIAVLLFLGYMFRRKLVKACCEKGQRGDLEKQSPPGTTEGSDKKTPQGEETQHLLDRAPTLPSKQRLHPLNQRQEIKELEQQGIVQKNRKHFQPNNSLNKLPADTQKEKNEDKDRKTAPPSHSDLNIEPVHHASNDKEEDADADKVSDSEEANESDPASVLDEGEAALGEDMLSDVQSSTAPEQTESEKEADVDEEAKSPPASGVTPPSTQLHSPSTQSSPHMAPEDIPVKLKEDTISDQVIGETAEKNHRESDSLDDSSEEKQSYTNPDRKGSETTAHEQDSHLAQGETDIREDNQQETDKPVSEVEKESDSVGDQEEIDKAQNQPIATSQQPQSATLTQVSPDIANADPVQEGKTIHDSDESEGQPDSSVTEENKGEGQSVEEKNEIQCGSKEEKPGNVSLNEGKDQMKGEGVE